MEKGPMYGNIKYKLLSLRAALWKESGVTVLFKFTMEREENNKLPFLDVLLDNNSNQGIITPVFHKNTGLLTNFYSFVPFSYKLGLSRTLSPWHK